MILAGDIGGTKTNLGLFEVTGDRLDCVRQESFSSKSNDNLEEIVAEFLKSRREAISAACFGIAGPIIDGRTITPNLPWVVDSASLAKQLSLKSVRLLNDLEATAYGIGELEPGELLTLNEGTSTTGNRALIAAGTGLGVALLIWDGKSYQISASEGGHVEFAPRNKTEIELLKYLCRKHAHVSVERVVSGPGLFNIYDFLRRGGEVQEDPALARRFETEDPSKVIALAALAKESPLAEQALDVLAQVYGAVAGNVALTVMATGGVYIGGGVAPKIKEKLLDGSFLSGFTDKGRMSSLMATMPVRVILNDRTALLGAARVAAGSEK
jgi:glucokinase